MSRNINHFCNEWMNERMKKQWDPMNGFNDDDDDHDEMSQRTTQINAALEPISKNYGTRAARSPTTAPTDDSRCILWQENKQKPFRF